MKTATEQFVQIGNAEQYCAFRPMADLPSFDAQLLQDHSVDAHWAIIDAGRVTARCSLWWKNAPAHPEHRIGLVGHYAAATDESAAALLEFVCQQLAETGCTLAVGPMDGNTWRDYRFVTETGGEPRFFLEPHNRPDGPAQFVRQGFGDFAHYFSALVTDLKLTSPRLERVQKRMAKRGIRIRSIRNDTFQSDLQKIYTVAQTAFREHTLYDEMGESEFLRQYESLRGVVPFDLVLLAEQKGRAVGFGFAVPDLLQARRGETVDTVVIKTLGVLPDREFAGLGQQLLEQIQHRAFALGYRRAIHALVRETGHLQKISRRYAVPFRRYSLFAKGLC
ncbi:MAG: GNAT family N-acetyltransferase [Planctomycetaceae bacterium]|nr:GNAT family N-acetyltransferase [Planctomycetaceae bacterium]MBT6486391.1 GNAT family N-acetyltransferase [Planctomycetaceae bacterium]MBT6495552.1 GNAT family N-acetyltransferase [Planctomycetaceae bacterium]